MSTKESMLSKRKTKPAQWTTAAQYRQVSLNQASLKCPEVYAHREGKMCGRVTIGSVKS